MKRSGLIVILIVVALVIGIPAFLLIGSKPETTKDSTTTATTQTTNTNLITYTNTGFTPSTLTVTAGSQVSIKNDSSRELQFDSDPHPDHTDNPELNVGTVPQGETKTFTVTRTGTHGYHNHKMDDDAGKLIVQ